MTITVLIPSALRAFTERQSEIEVCANTVGEAIKEVSKKYAGIEKHLYKDADNLRDFINVFLGQENIKNKDGLDTKVKDGDLVMLVPAIAGGKDTDTELSKDTMKI